MNNLSLYIGPAAILLGAITSTILESYGVSVGWRLAAGGMAGALVGILASAYLHFSTKR